nr:hypothetical protein [Neobacillus sp. Marseille-Q6967]
MKKGQDVFIGVMKDKTHMKKGQDVFIGVMKDKTLMKKKQNVLHRGYEGQDSYEKEAKCPSSGL